MSIQRGSGLAAIFGVIVAISFVLVACVIHVKHDENYFLEHPAEIERTINNCQLMPEGQATSRAECLAAVSVKRKLASNLAEFETNPLAFGKKILDLQMKLAQSQRELEHVQAMHASTTDIQLVEHRIIRQQQQLNLFLTVIRLATRIEA